MPFNQRPSGLQASAQLPWGTHFCVFYGAESELGEVLVPFLKAGLEGNELCSWDLGTRMTPEAAKKLLSEALPDFPRYWARGQIELVAPREGAPSEADQTIERRLDRAILAGFDGLRLVRHAGGDEGHHAPGGDLETIHWLNVIAAVLYPREGLGAVDLMRIVQDHRFALVNNSGRWELLEGSEVRAARDALERSEKKLQSLFSHMTEGFAHHRIVLDARGKPCDYVFLEVNPAFERLTGLSGEKIVGRRVTQVLPGIENDPADWIGRYARVALTGEPAQFESHSAALDKWYQVSTYSPHKGYFAVSFSDITDRKRAEAERRAAEERLLVTLRSIGDAVIATDMEGRVTLMNSVAESLTGWREEEARARPLDEVFQLIDEDTGAAAENPVLSVIEQDRVVGLANHTVLVARDGRRIAIADSAAPVRAGSGLLGVVLVFRDVTQARHAERERERLLNQLQDAQARLSADLQAMTRLHNLGSLFLYEGDLEPVLTEIVDAAIAISDADFGNVQVLDPESSRLKIVAHRGFPQWWLDFWASVTEGKGVCGTALERGERIIVEDVEQSPIFAGTSALEVQLRAGIRAVQSTPLRSRSGRPLGMFSTHYRKPGRPDDRALRLLDLLARQAADIIERAESEQALHEANRQLREADQRKNEFLAMLSHELRNPLTPIRNSLFVLDRAAPGGDQSQHAKAVIDRQVGHLCRLVDDLLDVTRITRGKLRVDRTHLLLNDLVARTAADHRPSFVEHGMDFEVRLCAQPIWLSGDATRLAQAVGNLLQNALKFTLEGGHVLLALEEDPSRRAAVIRVRDDGVGIDAAVLPRLFEPFMQADASLDRSRGGLGLGLALVKGVVELHDGTVSVQSQGLGLGTEFVVSLPLQEASTVLAAGACAAHDRAARRVLIIEDNPDAAESLRTALELSRHVVEVSPDGPAGLQKALAFRPEVVFCDIGLPGMDGFEVARAFRADETLKDMRLVALSGYALPEDLQRSREAGFDDHLAKPPDLAQIEELLADLSLIRAS